MEISQHIKNLLKSNERVILGGFGAFTTKHISASIDKETKVMKPPFKIVIFDSEIQEDAGLLVKYMAEQERISLDNSNEQIQEFIKTIKSKLTAGKLVEFKDLGSFKQSASGKIEFSFLSEDNLLLDSFGLPTVSLSDQIEKPLTTQKRPIKQKPIKEKPIQKEKPIKKPVEKTKPVKKEKPIKEKPVKQKVVKQKPIKQKPIKQKKVKEKPVGGKPKKKRKWLAVVIPIVAIGIMLAAVYFFKPDLWDKGYTYSVSKLGIAKEKIAGLFNGKDADDFDVITDVKDTTTVIENEIIDTTLAEDIVDTTASEVIEEDLAVTETEEIVEETTTNEVVEVTTNDTPTPAKTGKYYIIVSSVKSKSSAQQEQKRFSSKGINTDIIHVPSIGRYRLSLGAFNTAKAAQDHYADIQKKHGTISAWVWEKR